MKYLAALLAVCVPFVPSADASGCRQVVRKNVVVVEKQVVAVAAAVVPVISHYIQPLYGAHYTPAPQAAATDQELAAAVKALAAEVQELRRVMRPTMPPADGDPPAKPPKPVDPFNPQPLKGAASDVQRLFASRCAACHESDRASTKGGDFALLRGGELSPMDLGTAAKVARELYSGRMPKGGKPLTDQEIGTVMAWLDTLK